MPIGTIKGLSACGGLVTLDIQNDDGTRYEIHGDNGPTIRALDDAFGGVITPGHNFNPESVVGKKIDYTVDELGLLVGFDLA